MKLLRVICILALIIALSTPGFTEEAKRAAKVVDMEGQVEARIKGEKTWSPIETGAVLYEGDFIKTKEDSWALLNLNGIGETASIEINENSQLMLATLKRDEEKKTQDTLLDLAIGKVMIKAQKLHSEESKFEVKTPTSIVGVRGTTFSVEVEALE